MLQHGWGARSAVNRLVCSILVLASGISAQRSLDDRIAAALDRARPAVIRLLKKGAGGELALICLAAVHDGLGSRDKDFERAVARLAKSNLSGTYALSLRLMVMANQQDFPNREKIAASDARDLIERQSQSGGFSYQQSSGNWDLSNTQYAALGLRAAVSIGIEVPERTWQRLLEVIAKSQKKNGGFGYLSLASQNQATASMTVAGITVLEICLQQLDLDDDGEREIRDAIDKAWEWMADNKSSIGRLNERWCLYYHYGLERAAVLSDVTEVDGLDWYARGSEMILKLQRKSGAFMNPMNIRRSTQRRESLVDSAFAVLFLRRAFRRSLDHPVTPGPGYSCLTLPIGASQDEIEQAARNDTGRGSKAVPDLLICMRGNILARRKAAAMAIVKITSEDFGYHPYRSAEDNSLALRAIEGWWLKHRRN